jgi:nucleoside phosphorylase
VAGLIACYSWREEQLRKVRFVRPHSNIPSRTISPTANHVLRSYMAPQRGPSWTNSLYTVGFLCALDKELQAVRATFDERLNDLDILRHAPNPHIYDSYICGKIGPHYVVATCLRSNAIGTNAASVAAGRMNEAFPNLSRRFLVGIAGGVPGSKHDIRLGDVVIATEIVKYDTGKWIGAGKLKQTSYPYEPSKILYSALFKFNQSDDDHGCILDGHLSIMKDKQPKCRAMWTYPGKEQDVLFSHKYSHVQGPGNDECELCDRSMIDHRAPRESPFPRVFSGLVASADQVMRDALSRDQLKENWSEVLAFEMEAGGLKEYDFIVVRGICDYADSHKNKKWQDYAAATAAACAKELLSLFPDPRERVQMVDQNRTQPLVRRATDPGPNRASHGKDVMRRPHVSSPLGGSHTPFDFETAIEGDDSSSFHSMHRRVNTLPATVSTEHLGTGEGSQELLFAAPENRRLSETPTGSQIAIATSHLSPISRPVPPTTWAPAQQASALPVAQCDYSVEFLGIPEKGKGSTSTTIEGHESIVEIPQCDSEDPLQSSREIVLKDANSSKVVIALWLPQDWVRVRIENGKLWVEFANCNGKHWFTENGSKRYRTVYDRANPNVKVRLESLDSSSALRLQKLVLGLDRRHPFRTQIPDDKTVFKAVRSLGSQCEVRVYESFRDVAKTRKKEDLLILVTQISGDIHSEQYFLGPYLDFQLDFNDEYVGLELRSLGRITYTPQETEWPTWPPRWVTEHREGGPKSTGIAHDAVTKVRFTDKRSFGAFMCTLTGWHFRFRANVKGYHSYTRHPKPPSRRVMVTVWSKNQDLRILVGLYDNATGGISKWISSRIDNATRPHEIRPFMKLDPRHDTVVLKDVRTSKGDRILRSNMLAGSEEQREELKHQDFKFDSPSAFAEFVDILKDHVGSSNSSPRTSTSSPRLSTETGRSQSSTRARSGGSITSRQSSLAVQSTKNKDERD